MTERYKRNPNVVCVTCSKPTYRRPSAIEKNKGRLFCSIACYGIACRKEKPCTVCGKLMLSSLNKKTCSRTCSNKNRAGVNYKSGAPSRDNVKSQRFLKIRLLNERGKNCERCEYSQYEILQVHHKNRDRSNNNLSNLELICPNCHYEEHYRKKVG